MGMSLEQFIDLLSSTGLLSAAEVSTLCDGLAADQRPADAETLARLLVDRGKLTTYQAITICQGRQRPLVLGEYVILDELGAGGMGVVYKARHRPMGRLVAIKVLTAESLQAPEVVERFQREMKAAARLSHPNIVSAFDAGQYAGLHYLAMEYVEGKDLGRVLADQGPLPFPQALECIIQAAKGLEYAHAMGLVHRDIKPSNLLLSKDGQIKILDLGLARLREAIAPDVSTAAQLTQAGQVMGTVDYMSPEQAQDSHRADERSDIYSLGCTLYRLLIGEPPYRGDTLMNRMLAHLRSPIPSISARRGDVPSSLDQAFRRMVAKQPADRQQSMGQVIAELKACLRSDTAERDAEPAVTMLGELLGEASGSRVIVKPPSATAVADDTISRTHHSEDTARQVIFAALGSPQPSRRLARRRRQLVAGIALVLGVVLTYWTWWNLANPRNGANAGGGNAAEMLLGKNAGQEWDGNDLGMKFCWCPAGEFLMGSADNEPGHQDDENQVKVTFPSGFWMGKFEVSQREWQQLMGDNPSSFAAQGKAAGDVADQDTKSFPVEGVSWERVMRFCEVFTQSERQAGRLPPDWEYRLPTEAQWEYACRAGTSTATAYGDSLSSQQANFNGDAPYGQAPPGPHLRQPRPVGSYPPNPWGLHDMAGNVWEWCRDWYSPALPGGIDPVQPEPGLWRVIRGGAWGYPGVWSRSAARNYYRYHSGSAFGFRVVLVPVVPGAASGPEKPTDLALRLAKQPTITPEDGWIDLLPAVDLTKHQIAGAGDWMKTAKGLRSPSQPFARLPVPMQAGGPEDYRAYEIVGTFTRTAGQGVSFYLPVGRRQVLFVIDGWEGMNLSGLQSIDGKSEPKITNGGGNSEGHQGFQIKNGERYTFSASIYANGDMATICARVSGTTATDSFSVNWQGKTESLGLNDERLELRDSSLLGLGASQALVDFDRLLFRVLAGRAELRL
jgi:serine/threonine-protein kinase